MVGSSVRFTGRRACGSMTGMRMSAPLSMHTAAAALPGVRPEGGAGVAECVVFELADGTVLRAAVRRSPRTRRMRLRLTAAGEWRLSVPDGCPPAVRQNWLESLLPFVERAWRRYCRQRAGAEHDAGLLPEELELPVMGRTFAVRRGGHWQQGCAAAARSPYAPVRVEAGVRRLLLVEAESLLTLYGDADDGLAAEALRRWCRLQAGQYLPPLLESLAHRHGFAVSEVCVRDQRSRWGSCSRDRQGAGRIRLNWRALLLPREDAAFLCLHELCHIRQMNHSAAYREELARYAPDWPERERRLSRFWRGLPRWALPVS